MIPEKQLAITVKNKFQEWLETSEGKECSTPFFRLDQQQPYLQNRLWYAFNAGEATAKKEIERLKKESEEFKKVLLEIAEYEYKKGTLSAAHIWEARKQFKPNP